MDTMYEAATFTATRDELLGSEPLLGAAEIARGVCRRADRVISVLAITPDRMRRIDGWLGPVGFVTHAAAPEPTHALLGSVCDRDRSQDLIGDIMVSLVGALPDAAGPTAAELPPLDELSPESMPDGVDWVIVVSVSAAGQPPDRTILAGTSGLVVGDVEALDRAVTLDPDDPAGLEARLAAVVGTAPRSVRDLLADD